MARRIAAVESALPSPVGPEPVISKCRDGNRGGTIRRRISAARSQGAAVCADQTEGTSEAPATAPRN